MLLGVYVYMYELIIDIDICILHFKNIYIFINI